ncbi:MAG: MFS transporter [Deltaproteobacteria bacterium]|nr:MFS transporter [Deltaproteobacteria bacterium]
MSQFFAFFKAAPHIEPIQDKQQVKVLYKAMRIRMMLGMIIGYAAFYFVRKNFSMAMPSFLTELHYTKTDLGMILSLFSILYGVGKFFNGMLADRANPRYFMAIGLLGAAVVNVFFGMSSSLIFFGLFWLLNAWFQSMGWPPCARMLTHWYSPRELGTMWGIWNSSHQIGGAGILVMAGYLISTYGWRYAFYVPGVCVLLIVVFLIVTLRDTPQSLGLPRIEKYRGDMDETAHDEDDELAALSTKEILFKHVLNNKLIWYLCFANFFVYIVRIGVLDWAPTFLVEAKKSSLAVAGVNVASFEIAGIIGAILAGWLSDKVFKGRRGPANVLFMVALIFCVVYFWMIPPGYPLLDATALIAIGFFVYGPQMLVGVAAADFASKKASATATGLTGTFGYLGSTVCGVGTGAIVDKWGWNGGFIFFIMCAVIGTFLFALTWKQRSKTLESLHT